MLGVCGRLLAGIVGLNPAGGTDVCLECCASCTGLCNGEIFRPEESYLVLYLSDSENLTMKKPSLTRGCCAMAGVG
jgi:hypothetical protein